MKKLLYCLLVILWMVGCATAPKDIDTGFPAEGLEVSEVVSAFPVRFSMLTENGRQFIAYYDGDHEMTIAARDLGSNKWEYKTLGTKVGWDSHNSITMAFDNDGYLHLVGNLHASPLIYFRASKPYDIQSLKGIHYMTGSDETRTTYPIFMKSIDGNMIVHYRSGGSGNAFEVYNIYDTKTKTWSRLIDKPLIDGLGLRSAYMRGPTLSKDGFYHMSWVWRETPHCETNHTLSHARSRDLVNWESIRGEKVELPITINDSVLYVDTVKVNGGIYSAGILSFDTQGRPLLAYQKYDEVTSTFPNMQSNTHFDGTYLLRWESLPINRDKKPTGELPPPSKLMLYKLK